MNNIPKNKKKIRVKVLRSRDESGNLTPHKHKHSHGTIPSLDRTQDLKSPSKDEETNLTNSVILTDFDLTTNPGEDLITNEPTLENNLINLESQTFSELEPEMLETEILKTSKFIKNSNLKEKSDDEIIPFESRLESFTNITENKSLEINDQILGINFKGEKDLYFIEIEKELESSRKAKKLLELENNSYETNDFGIIIPEYHEIKLNDIPIINPSELYPKSKNPYNNIINEETFELITATENSAEFIEAGSNDSNALAFIEINKTLNLNQESDSYYYEIENNDKLNYSNLENGYEEEEEEN